MKKALSLLALTLSAIALVACGSSDSSTSSTSSAKTTPLSVINTNYCRGVGSGGGQTLKLSADPSGAPKYNTKCLIASKPGKVTIEFSNPSATPQDVAVKDPKGKVYGVSSQGNLTEKGGKTRLNLNLPSGRYVYYSTVPGDAAAGMLGTLLVK